MHGRQRIAAAIKMFYTRFNSHLPSAKTVTFMNRPVDNDNAAIIMIVHAEEACYGSSL